MNHLEPHQPREAEVYDELRQRLMRTKHPLVPIMEDVLSALIRMPRLPRNENPEAWASLVHLHAAALGLLERMELAPFILHEPHPAEGKAVLLRVLTDNATEALLIHVSPDAIEVEGVTSDLVSRLCPAERVAAALELAKEAQARLDEGV